MDVRVAHDGARALELSAATDFDVVVLDRDLPGIGGDAVCRKDFRPALPQALRAGGPPEHAPDAAGAALRATRGV